VKDPTEPVEIAMRRLEARWSDVTSRVAVSKESVKVSNVVAHFIAELDSLLNTIDIYDTWASSDAINVAKDFVQLSQQLDQCRVCLTHSVTFSIYVTADMRAATCKHSLLSVDVDVCV